MPPASFPSPSQMKKGHNGGQLSCSAVAAILLNFPHPQKPLDKSRATAGRRNYTHQEPFPSLCSASQGGCQAQGPHRGCWGIPRGWALPSCSSCVCTVSHSLEFFKIQSEFYEPCGSPPMNPILLKAVHL